jgi:hypothetical protein
VIGAGGWMPGGVSSGSDSLSGAGPGDVYLNRLTIPDYFVAKSEFFTIFWCVHGNDQ